MQGAKTPTISHRDMEVMVTGVDGKSIKRGVVGLQDWECQSCKSVLIGNIDPIVIGF